MVFADMMSRLLLSVLVLSCCMTLTHGFMFNNAGGYGRGYGGGYRNRYRGFAGVRGYGAGIYGTYAGCIEIQ